MNLQTVVLGLVIILQFAYILYQDISNRKEREKLQLLIKSKDAPEYRAIAPLPFKEPKKEKKEEEESSPYVPIEEVSTEKLLLAEDKI